MLVRLVQILSLLAAFGSVAAAATADVISLDTAHQMVVKIVGRPDQLQGHYTYVSVVKQRGQERFRSFDFLVSYDSNVLTFVSAELGSALTKNCGWKNFAAQDDWSGDCAPEGSIKSLRLVASVDPLGITPESLSFAVPDSCEIVRIKFLTTNDRTYDCASTPIRFYWQDCRDNSFCTAFGDTALISRRVFDTPGITRFTGQPRVQDITGIDCRYRVQSGGACPDCDSIIGNNKPVRIVDFYNGSVDFMCYGGSIDVRGDINLNGIANEITDVRMLADAILRGLDALPRIGRDGSIWGSDINVDNRPMTVADLVYLQRIIIGDALPYARQKPLFDTATVEFSRRLLTVSSPAEIGAVLAVFDCDSNCRVKSLTDFVTTDFYDSTAGKLRILVMCDISVYDTAGNFGCDQKRLPAGENGLFTIHGRAKLKEVQLSDYNGNLLRTNYSPDPWPTLSPMFRSAGLTDSAGNLLYPQSGIENLSALSIMSTDEVDWPHRAMAKIRLNFRDTTDWRVDIFNDRHQLALTYQGRDIGRKTITVDATGFCPGTYICTLTAGSITANGPLIKW
jgi:hypothetical protein